MSHELFPHSQQQSIFNQFTLNPTMELAKEFIFSGFDINSQFENGNSFLHIAALTNHFDIIHFLLNNGVNPNLETDKKNTPLFLACSMGHIETAHLLIQYGANVNSKNNMDSTPLHAACFKNFEQVFFALINNGADINIKNNTGHTSFHYICKYHHFVLFNYLFEKNIDVEINNCTLDGYNALHFAVDYPSSNHPNKHHHYNMINSLIAKGINVNAITKNGEMALHLAINNVNYKAIELLLNSNIDLNIKNNDGNNPLNFSIIKFMPDFAFLLVNKSSNRDSVIKSINCSNESGETPLHLAVNYNYLNLVQSMLNFDIDINIKNCFSLTPLDIAIKHQHLEIVSFLESYQNYKNLSASLSSCNSILPKKMKI